MCVLSKCGDSHILYLNQDHLNMLKLVTLKKLKEDFPDLNIRMELPGGLDVNRVTTPVLLNAPSSSDPASPSRLRRSPDDLRSSDLGPRPVLVMSC